MFSKTFTATLAAIAIMAMVSSAGAAIIFSSDFEGHGNTDTNALSTYDKHPPVPTGWVAANQGYGSGSAGLNLIDTNTVYSFRYTNSGLTTNAGVIGALTAGATYTVTFKVAADDSQPDGNLELPYTVRLVTFNGAARNDVRNNTGATGILASATGNAPGDGSFATVTFSYTADGTESTLGHDVAIRIFGATTTANIDDVSVDVEIIPEPATLALMGLGGLLMLRRRKA